MKWVISLFVGIAAVVGVLLVTNGVMGGLTAQQAEPGTATPARTVSVEQLRSEQRPANDFFELIPGEVWEGQSHSEGTRRDVRFTVTNFTERTLPYAYFETAIVAVDANGREVFGRASASGTTGWARGEGGLSAGGRSTGNFLVVTDPSAVAFQITLSYAEPGQSVRESSFVWPYRNIGH